jgi:hypothetical protein
MRSGSGRFATHILRRKQRCSILCTNFSTWPSCKAVGEVDCGSDSAGTASMQEVILGLGALRGIAHLSAVTIVVELGNITCRFERARDLMGYSGEFPDENSSGRRIRREAFPSPATRTADESLSNRPGAIDTGQRSEPGYAGARKDCQQRSRYCMESAEPSAQVLYAADGAREIIEKDHDRSGTRIVGLHLGHRDQGRSVMQATNGGMTITKEQSQELSK